MTMAAAKQYHWYYPARAIALLLFAFVFATTGSFVLRPGSVCDGGRQRQRLVNSILNTNTDSHRSQAREVRIRNNNNKGAITSLQLSPLPSIITNISSKISPPIRNSILIGSAAALLFKNRAKFYPSNLPIPDAALSEPLPNGSFGCPYFGNLAFFSRMGNAKTGSGEFYRYQVRRIGGNPQIFKYAPLGKPSVIVTGMANVKKVFNKEFKLVKTGVITDEFTKSFGGESLLFVTDQERHQFLRRLVGQSMTPEQIDKAMPSLMESATRMIDTLKQGEDVEMERVLTAFTLDVAWRQILGEISHIHLLICVFDLPPYSPDFINLCRTEFEG